MLGNSHVSLRRSIVLESGVLSLVLNIGYNNIYDNVPQNENQYTIVTIIPGNSLRIKITITRNTALYRGMTEKSRQATGEVPGGQEGEADDDSPARGGEDARSTGRALRSPKGPEYPYTG